MTRPSALAKFGIAGVLASALAIAAFVAPAAAIAATQTLTPSDDTFINSASPDNNNGGSASIFTGRDGRGGMMRGLIRFAMPTGLSGRVSVTNSVLTMTTQALGSGAPGTAAMLSLHPLAIGWIEGNGIGNNATTFVVGQPCTSAEPSWNHPQCTTGTWPAPGAPSGSAAVPVALNTAVSWTSAGMAADVQGWIDTPAGNNGWLIASSTEGAPATAAQRFFSSEAASSNPSLSITFSCKAGFLATGNLCSTCTAAATSACAVAQGNTCIDGGPPSTTYSCSCTAPGYTTGTAGGNPACISSAPPPTTLDIDGNGSYDALTDGLLIIRYMFGLRGASLIENAIGSMPQRTTSGAIETQLAAINSALDVDGNGQVDALTDGLVILRYLFGLRGSSVTANAIGPNAKRTSPQIETYVLSLMP